LKAAACAAAACMLLLTACAGTAPPPQALAEPAVPARWSESATAPAGLPQALFDDPVLAALTARALEANQDIALAAARLREARAQAGLVAAASQPSLQAHASYARERESANAPRAVMLTPAGEVETDRGRSENLYQAGFDAAWEIDLFGARRQAAGAAQADAQALAYDVEAVRQTVCAEVARQYVLLRAAQQQLVLARAELDIRNDLLKLAAARQQGGMASHAGAALAALQASRIDARMAGFELDAKTAMHRLGVLLGQPPGALRAELGATGALPAARANTAVSLPSELLRRRPDIRRAERQLGAATARRALAVTDLYPRVTLAGAAGVASVSGADLFSAASLFAHMGPSITWPILRRGQIVANIEVRGAQELAAYAAYRQAILVAFEEVENALAAVAAARTRSAALAGAVSEGELAAALAQARYQGGMADLRPVLEARIALAEARAERLLADAALASAAIALAKAAGGSWSAP
jgi:multidrug efflux system outer membrane protein